METMNKEIENLFNSDLLEEMESYLPQIKKRALELEQKDFHKISDLLQEQERKNKIIPNEPGLYFVGQWTKNLELTLCTANSLEFKNVKGGWYDRKWEDVKRKLENSKNLLYIGKAEDLNKRISTYMKFVKEMHDQKQSASPHRGGRAICLLKEVYELEICWVSLKDFHNDPESVEKYLLLEYKKNHNGDYPFANWRS